MSTVPHRLSNKYTDHDFRRRQKTHRRNRDMTRSTGRSLSQSPKTGRLSRSQLLETLSLQIDDEERAAKSLFFSFDLPDSASDDIYERIQNNGTLDYSSPESQVQSPAIQTSRNAQHTSLTASINNDPASDLPFCGKIKEYYLLTPVRKRYFPKLSPETLKILLSTPPLRENTPDYNSAIEDPTSSAADTSLEMPGGLVSLDNELDQYPEVSTIVGKNTVGIVSAWRADASLKSASQVDPGYPLTPPPSSRLPDVKSFSPTHIESESSFSPRYHHCAISQTVGHAYRSREDICSVISPESSNPKTNRGSHHLHKNTSSNPYASDHIQCSNMQSDTAAFRGQAHGSLSFSAVQNYQRVIDELRQTDNRSFALESTDALTSGPGMATILDASVYASDTSIFTSDELDHTDRALERILNVKSLPTSSESSYFCPPERPKYLDNDPAAIQDHLESESSLTNEFITLLLQQAATEEKQVVELRSLAARLEHMALQRRRLATLIGTSS